MDSQKKIQDQLMEDKEKVGWTSSFQFIVVEIWAQVICLKAWGLWTKISDKLQVPKL